MQEQDSVLDGRSRQCAAHQPQLTLLEMELKTMEETLRQKMEEIEQLKEESEKTRSSMQSKLERSLDEMESLLQDYDELQLRDEANREKISAMQKELLTTGEHDTVCVLQSIQFMNYLMSVRGSC